MKKRMLSLVLALVMLFSLAMPVSAAGSLTQDTATALLTQIGEGTLDKDVVVIYTATGDANCATYTSQYIKYAQENGLAVYVYDHKLGPLKLFFDTAKLYGSLGFPSVLAYNGSTQAISAAHTVVGMDSIYSLLKQAGLSVKAPAKAASTMTSRDLAARSAMLALQSRYPEGMTWTNSNEYVWEAPIYQGGSLTGHGCAGFAMILSDAAFGEDALAKEIRRGSFSYEDVRVGTILRLERDTHSAIVLETYDDHVVLAEGNFAGTIHWGRELFKDDVMAADYITVRTAAPSTPVESLQPEIQQPAQTPAETEKPAEAEKPVETEKPAEIEKPTEPEVPAETEKPEEKPAESTASITFADVDASSYYAPAVTWAAEKGITTGNGKNDKGEDIFSPGTICTRAHVVTFLWRTMGSPEPKDAGTEFADLTQDWYKKAVAWAVENGITDGAGTNAKGEPIFNPGANCSGAHIATFIYRAIFGLDASKLEGEPFYAVANQWIEDNQFTAGMDFSLTDGCSRADTVTFLYRYSGMTGN